MRHPAGMEAGAGVGRLHRALGDRVEHLERRDQGARLVELDLEVAVGHRLDVVDHPQDVLAEHVEVAGVGAGELPAHPLLRVRGAAAGEHPAGDPGDRRDSKPTMALHLVSLPAEVSEAAAP